MFYVLWRGLYIPMMNKLIGLIGTVILLPLMIVLYVGVLLLMIAVTPITLYDTIIERLNRG